MGWDWVGHGHQREHRQSCVLHCFTDEITNGYYCFYGYDLDSIARPLALLSLTTCLHEWPRARRLVISSTGNHWMLSMTLFFLSPCE